MSSKTSGEAPKTPTDGHPLDAVHYREYKIILRPERFPTPQSFREFAKLVQHTGEEFDVTLTKNGGEEHHIREVLFYDTDKFDLYNHSFILRTRRFFQDGWPQPEQELTIKFRNPDVEAAAAVDMQPTLAVDYRIKFKEELLPRRSEAGGIRSLFSHNCVVCSSSLALEHALGDVAKTFPALHLVQAHPKAKIALVNSTAVEEVFTDLGELRFGHGLSAKATLAVWRNRATEAAMVGEFAFQCKFDRYDDLHTKPKKRSEDFFKRLQLQARDWLKLGTTKTAIVYGLGATAPTNHE